MWEGFVATRSDLEPRLRVFEVKVPLKYIAEGFHSDPEPEIFYSALEIPQFGDFVSLSYQFGPRTISPGSPSFPQRYLILPVGKSFVVRQNPPYEGRVLYPVFPDDNPITVEFAPGGVDADGTLHGGWLYCDDDSIDARTLFTQLQHGLFAGFVRALDGDDFRTFWWLGPEALAMLQRGEKVVADGEPPIYPCEHLLAENAATEAEHEATFVKQRRNFKESWAYLWEETNIMDQEMPRTPPSRVGPAGYDRKGSGISFYKMDVRDETSNLIWRLENLTIPSLFFCRCGISEISFRNSSLKDSSFCWNDFDEVDFRDADLSRCDLRCSTYRDVNFAGAVLRRADLRMSTFERCDFTGADLTGAKLTRDQASEMNLSEEQQSSIDWQATHGPDPKGG